MNQVGARSLGLMTSASELEDLAQMAFTERLLRPVLSSIGARVTLGDLDNLRGGPGGVSLCGRRIDALYRYVPYEGMLGTTQFTAMCEAQAEGRLQVLNGLYGLLLQHKGLLAWIWEHRTDPRFNAEERAAIDDHLPTTRFMHESPGEIDPHVLVAKQVFGREGEEVFFGEDLPLERWETLRRKRAFVEQRKVDVMPVTAAIATSRGPEVVDGYATVGAFAVAGDWAGYYTRIGGKIITSRAKWLATFVG
jgi:glutathionylspermidine synthase